MLLYRKEFAITKSVHNLKTKLASGEIVFGTLIGWGNEPEPTVSAVKQFGYDFFLVDLEHSLINKESVIDYIRLSRKLDIPVLLRPEENYASFRCYLDAGIDGLVLPQVDTVEQAVFAVNQTFYPPIGHRGVGIGASQFLLDSLNPTELSFHELTDALNSKTLLFPQTESIKNISNLRHILKYEGITGTAVGAYDLSVDVGSIPAKTILPDIVNTKAVEAKLIEIAGICKDAGKPALLGGFSPKGCAHWAKEGYQGFTIGYITDGKIQIAKRLIEETKALL